MSGALFNEARTDERPIKPAQGPGPGLFDFDWDATKASAEDAFYDVPGRSAEMRSGELAHAAAELARTLGKRPDAYYMPVIGEPAGNAPIVDEAGFWRDLRQLRQTRPDVLKDLGRDRADFDQRLRNRLRVDAESREDERSHDVHLAHR